MDTVRPPARTRWVRLGLTAAGLALGWTALTLVTGWGAAPSHASDDDDSGLLGSLVSTVDKVTDLLPAAVEEPLDQTVERVEVATANTVRAVSSAVDAVVETTPATKVTDVVTDVIEKVPVVGRVADKTGATDAVDAVGDSGSGVVDTVGGVVDTVVDVVVPAGSSSSPDDDPAPSPDTPDPSTPTGPTETVVDDADAGASSAVPPAADDLVSASLRQAVDAASVVSAAAVGRAAGAERTAAHLRTQTPRPPADLPGLPGASPAVATAAGGASPGAFAGTSLPAHAAVWALHAWTASLHRPGAAPPPSPVFPPDASPD